MNVPDTPHRIVTHKALGSAREQTLEPARDDDLHDAAQLSGGHTPGVVHARNEADVAETLRRHPAILPVGARTSVTGGATPMGAVVLSLERFDTIEPIGPDRVRVGAGVSLQALNAWLAERGQHFPPAPSYALAQVGGAISTNAAGPNTFKYGATRHWVEGLRVVLANGDVLDLVRGQCRADPQGRLEIATSRGSLTIKVPDYRLPAVPKVSAGYFAAAAMDLVDLFVGSEGTLGVIVSADLRVLAPAPRVAIALARCGDEALAFALNRQLRAQALTGHNTVSAIEYLDARSLALVGASDPALVQAVGLQPGQTALIVQAESSDGAWMDPAVVDTITLARAEAVSQPDLRGAILDLRAAVPVAVNALVNVAKRRIDSDISKVAGDMIVPFDHFEAFTAATRAAFTSRGLDLAVWGHSSDGNLHPNLLPRAAADVYAAHDAMLEIGRLAIALGGSPLAEHGVGRNVVKQRLLGLLYGDAGLAQMRAVKHVLDPEGKLAPGVLL